MVMWRKGFNFRETPGWATDQADETHVSGAAYLYPQERNGVRFGFEGVTIGFRDRGAGGLDRRLAGCALVPVTANTPVDFRIDLPVTGALYTYTIRLARGDASVHAVSQTWALLDTTTVLASWTAPSGHVDFEYIDATGVTRTDVTWPSNNAPITETFTTLIARHRFDAVAGEGSAIAHILMEVDLGDIIQVSDSIQVADRRRVPI